MTEEKLLTVRDVAVILGVSEKDVLDLAENSALPAYKVGGVYLRFKKEQVEQYKKNSVYLQSPKNMPLQASLKDQVHDFFYFNDFYIFVAIFIILLGILVFRGL